MVRDRVKDQDFEVLNFEPVGLKDQIIQDLPWYTTLTFDTISKDSELPAALTKGLTLSVVYGADIGGMGTLTGTPPNLVASGLMSDAFPCYSPEMSFSNWLMNALPLALVFFILVYVYLQVYWIDLPRIFGDKSLRNVDGRLIEKLILKKYNALPRITFAESYQSDGKR